MRTELRPVRVPRYWLAGIDSACVGLVSPDAAGDVSDADLDLARDASRCLRQWLDRNGGGHVDCWAVTLPAEGSGRDYRIVTRHAGTPDGALGERLAASLMPNHRAVVDGLHVGMWGDATRVPDLPYGALGLDRDPAAVACDYIRERLDALRAGEVGRWP